jgi:N-acetylneuraminic acid mutarotase
MERWGHQLVKVSENKIILFGGFGGTSSEGKYLDDLWEFNTTTFTWKQLHHKG